MSERHGSKQIKWLRIFGTCAAVFVVCAMLAYGMNAEENVPYTFPDKTALNGREEYVRDHPQADFDNDGVANREELKRSTDPRCADADKIYEIAVIDTSSERISAEKKVPIILPEWNRYDLSRYGANHNHMEDLIYVYYKIDNGRTVVAAMFSSTFGEVVGLVYGYTQEGALLVADIHSLLPAGEIHIVEKRVRLLLRDSHFSTVVQFEFKGCGFNSKNGDTIHFMRSEL